MYDIIGDVHGHADELLALLERLGYEEKGGFFRHPVHKAIFVGDLVNKGPQVREAVSIVRSMVEGGSALAILGNHEYNLITYLMEGKEAVEHPEKLKLQLEPTLQSYKKHHDELKSDIAWLRSLPLFLELKGIRVVHACWDQEAIDFFRMHYEENRLSKKLLEKSLEKETHEHLYLNSILNGPTIELPKGLVNHSHHLYHKESIRIKWWNDTDEATYKDLCIKHANGVEERKVPKKLLRPLHYPVNSAPVFFGHYCLHGQPAILRENVCCVDFCIAKHGVLSCYAWEGERKLLNKHFYTADTAYSMDHHVKKFIKRIFKVDRWLETER